MRFLRFMIGVTIIHLMLDSCTAYGQLCCPEPQQYNIDGVPLEAMAELSQEDLAREYHGSIGCRKRYGRFSCLEYIKKIDGGYRYICIGAEHEIDH